MREYLQETNLGVFQSYDMNITLIHILVKNEQSRGYREENLMTRKNSG